MKCNNAKRLAALKALLERWAVEDGMKRIRGSK